MKKDNCCTPVLDEYEQKIKELFIKNCLPKVSEKEKEEYLETEESKEIIKNCYNADKYMQENFDGFENVFSDYSILSRTCRTLEDLY